MNKKIASNFFYQASYQVLLVILPIITIPVVSKALGAEGIGTFSYINSIVGYFGLLAGLGLQNYGVREIALIQRDKEELSRRFWELQWFNTAFSGAMIILYAVFALTTQSPVLYLACGLTLFANLLDVSWFFGGVEDYKRITIRNFVIRLLTFVCIVLFVKSRDDLLLYILITVIGNVLSSGSLWLYLPHYIHWSKVSLKDTFRHFHPALQFFIAKIAMTLYMNLTTTILGLLTTMTVVGYYSNSLKLVVTAGSIINAMNTVLIPRMSSLYGDNAEDKMIQLLQKTVHLQLYFTIAITFGIIAINEKMIDWFFGSDFQIIVKYVPILAFVLIFQSLQQAIAAQYLIPKGQMREYNGSVMIGAVICVLLNVLITPFAGIYGAITGILVGYIVIAVLRSLVLVRQTTFHFEWQQLAGCVVSGLVMWLVVDLVTGNMNSSIKTTLTQVMLGSLVYVGTSLILRIGPIIDLLSKIKFKKAGTKE